MIGHSSPAWDSLAGNVSDAGYDVISAYSDRQSFKMLEQNIEAGIVLLDVSSVTDNGIKFLRDVKIDRRLQSVAVMMVGQKFDEATVREYHKLGVHDIMMLPIAMPTLVAKLSKAELDVRRTILVVDDEPMIVELLTNFMEMERYEVLAAYSGEQALEQLHSTAVHAVVSDIMMPGMSGLELLVEVKLNYPGIPFILITGHSGQYTPQSAIEAGADGFFSKPFHNIDLSYTLRRVLQHIPATINSHTVSRQKKEVTTDQ